jgi:hypothetical protein
MEETIFVFYMDGDQWSCCIQGFNDLQKDPFGFGPDKKSALQHLLEQVGDDLT